MFIKFNLTEAYVDCGSRGRKKYSWMTSQTSLW